MADDGTAPSGVRRLSRGTDEFARVLAFSDGMFAIAMTLLVVGIEVPDLDSPSERALFEALGDLHTSYVSFFVSFVVIGRFWVAHHQFFKLLERLDYRLIWLNLIYLAFIAFLPFPTALIGNFFDYPVAIAFYAVAIAVVSGLESLMLRHAHRAGLMARTLPEAVYRWAQMVSTVPVLVFVVSIPVAFLSTWLAVVLWFASFPLHFAFQRSKPPQVDEYVA